MSHLAFPLHVDARGRVGVADHEHWLTGLIEQVLFTKPGERVNRPGFGTGLLDLVFEPLGAGTADMTTALIRGALQTELGELIRVEDIDVVVEDTTVHVSVQYQALDLPAGESRVIRLSGESS